MLSDRIVVRSNTDNHVLFKVFRAYYPTLTSVIQPYCEHHHSELEISAIVSGRGVYVCSGVDYDFAPGDVFMHCGNDCHSFKEISGEEKLSLQVFQFEPRLIWTPGGEWFDPKYLQLFMENSVINRHIPHETETAQNICRLLDESFEECCAQKPAYEMIVKAKLLTILANMARHYHNDIVPDSMRLNVRHVQHIEHTMDYILSNLNSELTLDMLAKEARMSRSYYCTMFKTLNGISVWDYILSQRIDKAQHLLESSCFSVTEVSEACGFNNIANFNRAFKKITGKTPSDYKKAAKTSQTAD